MGAGGNQRATLEVPNTASAGIVMQNNSAPLLPSRPAEEVQLPFRMELARPRKMRFELDLAGQTAIQVYDGTNGWKFGPYLNRPVAEAFTEEELKISSAQSELYGRSWIMPPKARDSTWWARKKWKTTIAINQDDNEEWSSPPCVDRCPDFPGNEVSAKVQVFWPQSFYDALRICGALPYSGLFS